MAAKRDMPAQDSDDFEWVNAWAASALPSVPAVAPEIAPAAMAIAPQPAQIEPKDQRAIESAGADGPQRVTSFSTAPSLEPAAEACVDPVADIAADAQPLSLPEPVTCEIVQPAPTDVGQDATSVPLVPEETTDQQELAATTSGADRDAVVETVAATPESDELTSASVADEKPAPSAPISFLDFARRAKRSLFGIVARDADPQPEPAAVALEDIADLSDPVAAGATVPLESDIAPDQLERDIAEIEIRRDALYAEWERSQRFASPAARSRTTDYVPILLGAVLGFTLLVVFGAAASFVSLR